MTSERVTSPVRRSSRLLCSGEKKRRARASNMKGMPLYVRLNVRLYWSCDLSWRSPAAEAEWDAKRNAGTGRHQNHIITISPKTLRMACYIYRTARQ